MCLALCAKQTDPQLLVSKLKISGYYYIVEIKTHRIIILPVVLYGCETWSLTLREECRLWVFENRVLKRTLEAA